MVDRYERHEHVPCPAPAATGETPPHRYSAALAQDIETGWQDWWDAHHTFETPNPPACWPIPTRPRSGEKLFVLDMFPYPSGIGLHVGHPLGFIGTDVYARFKRMTGHNVLHTMGFDAFRLPGRAVRGRDRHPSRDHDRPERGDLPPPAPAAGPGARPAPERVDDRPEYYRWTQWIFNQIFNAWYDTDAGPGPSDRRAGRRVRAGPCHPRRQAVGRAVRRRARRRRRRSSARLRQRRAGELVSRLRHGRGQRRGHRRRALRPRQLPCLQAQHAPVDDAHHGLRRPPDRRPRPARLVRRDQDDAAQLDRPQHGARCTSQPPPGRSWCSRRGPTRCSARPFMVLAPEHPSSTR